MAIDLQTRLDEAEAAYHRLMLGETAVEFRDQNGELIRYSAARASYLRAYILDLRHQLGLKPVVAPGKAWF